MKISRISIRNFRGIKSLDLDLGTVTVLIGENNTGKTSILDAVRLCLQDADSGSGGRLAFDGMDFHLADETAEPWSAEPIRIEVTFSEAEGEGWDEELVTLLSQVNILQTDEYKTRHVVLRVDCKYDALTRDFAPRWTFARLDGTPIADGLRDGLDAVQDATGCYYLAALRDAGSHFDAKGPFWRPFLLDSQLSLDQKTDIEESLQAVNDMVISSHASFKQVRAGLRRIQSIVPLAKGDAVSIDAVPGRVFDLLARAQVQLGTVTGARIPLARHGEGTQSLAVLMLFAAFLGTVARKSAMLALEEPEAHLHPSAIRTLLKLIRDFRGQKIISTHSGELLAEVDVHDIRRLARTPGGIQTFHLPPGRMSGDDARKFNYHIRRTRGQMLFARCWLLVEGESDFWVYSAAANALGFDLHSDGVRIVEFSQCGAGLLAKVAGGFGISWYCVGDDDKNRRKVEGSLRVNLDGFVPDNRIAFPYPNLEVNLLRNGYEDIYEDYVDRQRRKKMTTRRGSLGYWAEYAKTLPRGRKTRAAAAVAAEMEARGKTSVTPEIRRVLTKAVALARNT